MKKIFVLSLFLCALGASVFAVSGCSGHSHNLTEWEVNTCVSCTTDETFVRYCLGCDYKEYKTGQKKYAHNYIDTVVPPTATANGYTLHLCACTAEYRDNYKCLVSFESKANSISINESDLPQLSAITLNKGTEFTGITATADYEAVEYYISNFGATSIALYVGETIENSCNITVVWKSKTEQEPTAEETAFNNLLLKIKKLEDISANYNAQTGSTNDAQMRVLQYIRNARYNTSQWNSFGGELESDFANFVIQNQGEYNLAELQTIDTFTVPQTGEKVDFVHLMAVINVLINPEITANAVYDLVGFGGDLCQLAVSVKNSSTSGTYAEVAGALFMAEGSTFSSADLFADLDAINIGMLYDSLSTKSISGAMGQYYGSITAIKRKDGFKQNGISELDKSSKTALASDIISRLNSSLYIKVWCSQNGISFSTDADIFTAVAEVFAEYILS